ncbi:MAG TPA: murein L,D-transpeptidase catalytic domain family protein [Myxococcota bacterium]
MVRSAHSIALTLAGIVVVGIGACASPVAPGVGEGVGEGEGAVGEGEGAVGEGEGALGEGEGAGEGEGVVDDCPVGVICVDALPFTASGNTLDGVAALDGYSCAPGTNESGPELVYRVAIPSIGGSGGILAVTLDAALEAGDTDVDVHILSADDASACLDRGDSGASAHVDGPYAFVVMDSFVRSDGSRGAGPFSATITFTAAPPPGENPIADAGVPLEIASLAIIAFDNALAQGLSESHVLTVVDYSESSVEQRLWTVNVDTGELLLHDRVAHGSGSNSASDPAMATTFSNTSGSNQSSLGLIRTAETYDGEHGYSLRLDGLEPSNDNMRDRAIVMHGASYAEDDFVDQNGYLGRSNGCLAVAQSRSASIIDVVKEGTLIFSYYPDADWLASSPFLQ